MKKIFSLIILTILFVSCGGPVSYKIEGTVSVDGLKDGDTISLGYSVDGAKYTPESYATINNGKFEFSGKTENCKLYYLVNHMTEEPLAILFLEGGNIVANIDNEKNYIKGSKSNDLYTKLQEELTVHISELQEKQMRLYVDTTLTEEQRESIINELQTLSDKASNVAKDFITTNIETMPGLFMLVQCASMFDNEEFDNLVAKIPEENKDSENNCLFAVLQDIQEQRNNPQDFSDYFKATDNNESTDSTVISESKDSIK